MTADTLEKATLHQMSLAVWDIPTPVRPASASPSRSARSRRPAAGSAAARIEVLDGEGVVAAGHLGDAPWPGTDALFWAEVELRAPNAPGLVTLTVRFDAAELASPTWPLRPRSMSPSLRSPNIRLTVKVTGTGLRSRTPCSPRPHPRHHRRLGRGHDQLAKGRYELVVWKAGYEMPVTPIDVDAFVADRCRAPNGTDPDAVWTA